MPYNTYTPDYTKDYTGVDPGSFSFHDLLNQGYSVQDAGRLVGGVNSDQGANYLKYYGDLNAATKALQIAPPVKSATPTPLTYDALKAMNYNDSQIAGILNGPVNTNRAFSLDANGNPVYENASPAQPAPQTEKYTLNGQTFTTKPGEAIPVGGSKISDSSGTYVAPPASSPAPTTTPAPVIAQTPNNNQAIFSGVNLQVGSKGAPVTQLQTALGITADGIFGPKTQAAVKAFQASHGLITDGIVGPKTMAALNQAQQGPSGVDNVKSGIDSTKSGNSNSGGINYANNGAGTEKNVNTNNNIPNAGKSTIDSLIETLNNQSPQKSFTDVYKEAYTSLGLDTMKSDYQTQTKAYSDLQNEKNDKIQEINNNPWYSEGVRQKKLTELDKQYEGKELILQNKLKLLETGIENGKADAQFLAGGVMDQLNQSSKLSQDVILKAIDIAEKQAEAKIKDNGPSSVQEYEYAVKQGYKGSFSDYQNEDANRKAIGAGGGYKPPTSYQEWELAGKPGTYANWLQEQNIKAPTTAQQTVATYATRIEQSNPIITSLQDKISKMNPIKFEAEQKLPSYLQSDDFQSYDQASRNFINSVLRRESGAVISPSEFSNAYLQYLPRAGDTAKTLAQKKQNRDVVYASLKSAAGNAYQSVDDLLGGGKNSSTSTSEFDYLTPQITTQGSNAYLPRSEWDKITGVKKDDLLNYFKSQGFNLLIN